MNVSCLLRHDFPWWWARYHACRESGLFNDKTALHLSTFMQIHSANPYKPRAYWLSGRGTAAGSKLRQVGTDEAAL
jgi:hypothetical protein